MEKKAKNMITYQKNVYLCQRFNKQLIVLQIKKAKKMKKLVFMFVAIAALSFASCGEKTTANENAQDTTQNDTLAGDTTQNDSLSGDSINN